MSDESIVIDVKDSVASSISTKLRAIATDARDGYKAVTDLQKGINSLGSSNLKTLTSAATSAASGISKVTLANEALAAAQQKTISATANAATAQQKLSTEQQKTAAAATLAAAATAKLATATANAAQQSALAAQQLAAASAKATAAQDAATLAAMRLADAQGRAQARTQANALAQANAATTAATLAAQTGKTAAVTDKYVMSAKAQAFAMRGIPAQMTDIVVSLQGGQRPLTVLMQQGGQLKDMFGGIGPAARAMGAYILGMVNPFTIAAAALAGFAVVVGMVESRMRELNGLVAQFAVTGRGSITGSAIQELRKELELLPGVSRSAATEVITAFASVRSVGGENLKASSLLVADLATALGTTAPKAAEIFAKALDKPTKGAISLDEQLGMFTIAQFKAIDALEKGGKTAEAQAMVIDILSKSIKGLAYDALTPMQKATTDLGNAWNRFSGEMSNSGPIKAATELLITLLNALTNMIEKLSQLQSWQPPGWVQSMMNNGPNSWIGDNFAGLFGGNKGAAAPKVDNRIVGDNTIKPNSGKQFGQTTEFKTDAAGLTHKKSDHSAETRATALAKINLQLDNEFKLLNMLGPERDKTEQFDRIEESLTGRKIKLNEQETQGIKDKIAAIVDNRLVSEAMNRIYDEAKGPQLEWNATITASDKLLKAGKITQDEYNKAMVIGEEKITNIRDPLREYNKDITDQLALSKLTTEQMTIESYIQKVKDDLLAKGIDLTNTDNKAIADNVEKLRQRKIALEQANLAQSAENTILDQTVNKHKEYTRLLDAQTKLKGTGQITPGQSAEVTADSLKSMGIDTSGMQVAADANVSIINRMYDQIKQAQDRGLLNETDAANARFQIWRKSQEGQLASAQSFFTGLEGLQGSSNKKLAAVGRAAAISNAIIDTYKSATGAYAAMSAIPYVGPALGAAAAAAAIAAGMANVAKIRSQGQGFQAGGYTGNAPVDKVTGVVHGKEWVMNAPATSRIGAGNLQALQDGSASVVRNSKGAGSGVQNNGATAPAATPVNVPLRIVNVMDPKMIGDYLATPEGEQVFINTFRRNKDSLQSSASANA